MRLKELTSKPSLMHPNVGALLRNLSFNTQMENQVMFAIMRDKSKPADSARAWLKKNPAVLDQWLKGVTTVDGKNGSVAVKKSLGL